MTSIDRKIYTLSALGLALENHFLKQFGSQNYWVTAEITKINIKSGHFYLQLADTKENITTAQISAYIWSTRYNAIKKSIGNDIDSILQPGNNALFQVKIEYHKVYGLKLNVLHLDPNYSYGEIEKRKQATIKRLKKEGLFPLQKKLYFPTLSKRIALVGSPDTSGFRDFRDEIYNNSVYRNFKLKYFKTAVQGEKSKKEIINAIRKARCYDVDAIVVIRGGGSKIDLDVFNDYNVCKTICQTRIPVLTGIGHETDEVVADLVAHLSFITPTAVAKHLYVQIGNFRYFLSKYYDQIMTRSLEHLGLAKDEFYHQNKYLMHFSQEIVKTWREAFLNKAYELGKYSQRLTHSEKENLSNKSYQLQRSFNKMIDEYHNDLNRTLDQTKHKAMYLIDNQKAGEVPKIQNKINLLALGFVEQARITVTNKSDLLALLNPTKILKSGYTISTVEDKDVHLLEEKLEGKEMKTLASNMLLTSKIIKQEKI